MGYRAEDDGTNAFKYDPFGRRTYKSSPSGATVYGPTLTTAIT
jgi:hypothetical protein